MSENNQTNSICTTEDAFEQFQASAMCEEDEFITLSDIVPPQPEVPDISNELNEIPYDNEVVLPSTNDNTPLNSIIESNEHSINEQQLNKDISIVQSYPSKDIDAENGKIKKNQKRGRKKTKSIQNDSDSSFLETENNSYIDNQAVQDNVHSTTVDKNGTEVSDDLQMELKYPRRTRRERVPNTSKYPLISETTSNDSPLTQTAPVRRRGRPKKSSLENLSVSEPDSTNIDISSSVNEDLSTTENSKPVFSKQTAGKRGRRGRPKASQTSLEQSKPNDSHNNISESKDTDLPLAELKKPIRRGRKKVSDAVITLENSLTESEKVGNSVNLEIPHASDQDNKTEEPLFEPIDMDMDDDDGDDICLSKLKENINSITDNLNDTITADENIQSNNVGEDPAVSNIADFEEHIDNIVQQTAPGDANNIDNNDGSLLVEDTSKRPNRRKAKQNFKYDVDSEEDPFANVEISDDDEPKSKKKSKYTDDYEYIPENKKSHIPSVTSSSDSELHEDDENLKKLKKRRRISKNVDGCSPRKRGRKKKPDLEVSVDSQSPPLSPKAEDEPLSMKPPAEAWATSNEFENFIAQKIQSSSSLKIKKVSSKQKTDSNVVPLDIPVINQNEPKKCIETGSQTNKISVSSTGMQTCVPYDIPMKVNLNLTSEQSEKACAFLNSVVKTTAELGQLMKDKSDDFMKKKINTDTVTDTYKMDYCVRKSFLLFKLAKHNLMQMEEDLAKQYDEFLRSNNLSSCRDQLKNIEATPKVDSDSDCEIVDVKEGPTASDKKKEMAKINKTVFLNKELSIKIAKKPSADKNVDVKGRHTIWINDSVMVKKVKPTQSFLAQDSRNKKPPDYVTEKMVSDFFENYYRQKAVSLCSPYTSTEWSSVYREYACHYFVKCNDIDESDLKASEISQNIIEINASTSTENCSDPTEIEERHRYNPKSLASLCAEVVSECLNVHNAKGANEDLTCHLTDGKNEIGPLSLFRLCYGILSSKHHREILNMSDRPPTCKTIEERTILLTVPPLKVLCYKRTAQLMAIYEERKSYDNDKDINENTYYDDLSDKNSFCEDVFLQDEVDQVSQNSHLICPNSIDKKNDAKSLFSLCVNFLQTIYMEPMITFSKDLKYFNPIVQTGRIDPKTKSPSSLKDIVYKFIKHFMFGMQATNCFIEDPIHHTDEIYQSHHNAEDFTINCVNTMSDEAFHSLEAADEFQDDDDDDNDYEPDNEDFAEDGVGYENFAVHNLGNENVAENNRRDENFAEDSRGDENEWAAQVQMQVLSTCITPADSLLDTICDETSNCNVNATPALNAAEYEFHDTSTPYNDQHQNIPQPTLDNIHIAHIKLEPQDEIIGNVVDSSIVKTEPIHGLDGMTIIPESIVTKSEMIEHEHNTENEPDESIVRGATAYDVNTFEQFVRKNKMMRSIDDESDDEEDIFGSNGLRERREHEPDHDAEYDMNESLLIPQTYEPLHIDNAKGVLMASSSDESNKDGTKKSSKKKIEKKKLKGKQKKGKETAKNTNTKEIPAPTKEVPVPVPVKDIAPKNAVAILTRRMREKIRQEEEKNESSDSETENIALSLRKDRNKTKGSENTKPTKNVKQSDSSSDKNLDNEIQCNNVDSTDQTLENRPKSKDPDEFTGFSAIDQNEISSYQKYMQFVYDKIVPPEDDNNSPENADCNGTNKDSNRSSSPLINPEQPVELLECEPSMPIFEDEVLNEIEKRPKKVSSKKKESKLEKDKPKFTEQKGWHIYSIDPNDAKLYLKCHIPLEKLPESFVDTYLEYHDITRRDNIDKEVDRLANLQSLNRATILKDSKSKTRQKVNLSSPSEQNSENVSRAASPANSDCFDELTPSEDEGANVEGELPPPVPERTTENNVAKNSLMDENESDSESPTKAIKQEIIEGSLVEEPGVKRRPGPKSKTKMNKPKPDILPAPHLETPMLTADKMMNKELTLLHAPIIMKQEVKEVLPKEPSPKDETKIKKRSPRNLGMRDRLKTEDDSSSEEEKQWVSTKEKLLKRIGRKEDALADDAKRAKLVDDFIERRGEGPDNRRSAPRSGRRSRKKMLERLKQQRFLSQELLGEPSTELAPGGKRGAANVGLFKGRRNIRKVIDKKSLQKSTVLANMEEFERKRRLNSKLNQLRELLGCEEGVNVLVINDEVCLEYDFQEQRPVVTVHPFFTKVMKAHQYEGVKFMWDACFESLASIEAGHGGGGCILAHCMGLGKTLQVLALLHTVLTHPRAGMHRVLVCCPLSTVLNWVDEIHKWIGPVTDQIKVFELSKLKKTYERAYQLEDWYNGGGIFIIGYELFRSLTTLDPEIDEIRPTIINKIRTALLDPGPDIIICDEGHLLKNDSSVLAVAMSRVVTKRRIVLTGTPMQNNLREYYCMVNFVKPNLLGTYSEYSNRFENPIMNGQHRDSREEDIKLMKARTHILHKVLEGCLQRQEASVLYPYLPKKHEYTVFIPLTKCQWDLYKHYVHHYTMKSKQSVLRDFHILQKIWSHPLVLHNFSTRDKRKEIKAEKLEDDLALEDKEDIKPPATETWWLQYLADGAMLNSIDCSNKFVAVFRILHECIALGDKVLIFSTSLDCLDALEHFLKHINGWNLGQEYYRLDGSVPVEVRQKWVREYNAESNLKTKLFLISTRAGCLGLNMTAANRVIILDTSWNPAHDIQSIFRVYRFGQKKDCYIYRLVAMGTMEQKIYERSVTKQAVACRVVDEQQIDRHYNMAELTELYRFDEHGVGVAGGVAVGVADVALLRVARDAAVHAVHEHDSLLRGSGEQGLPEHERAAAWMQFQQEHATKQMQNDMETDKAARALKKQQEQELLRQQLELQRQQQELERQQAQVLSIKTEGGPVHEQLAPRPARARPGYPRGRGRSRARVVQCRIPIRADSEQAGPSRAPPPDEDLMVEQISSILIKHNYTDSSTGPEQIQELVGKVKRMTQAGQASLEGCDELTASIAGVLLKGQHPPARAPSPPMPALTNVEAEPRRGRGRPRKSAHSVRSEPPDAPSAAPPPAAPPPATPPPASPPAAASTETSCEEVAAGGRRRRRAALAAERYFDASDEHTSQDSAPPDPVIQLDDDDWHAAASDTDSSPETAPVPAAPTPRPGRPRKQARRPPTPPPPPDDSSILLSDDEPPSPPAPPAVPPITKQEKDTGREPIPLHPSLLTNQNFIKIVAHTYLAGNPMLDEDAATLAAQYSTYKLLKETESSGRPIYSGPIYDIASKVLGVTVLQKLQQQSPDPKSKDSADSDAAASKMAQFLRQDVPTEPAPIPTPASAPAPAATPTPNPAPTRPRPGPKSRVKVKAIKEESTGTAKPVPTTSTVQKPPSIVPISVLRGAAGGRSPGPRPAPPAQAAGECILPDDDDVRCVSDAPPPPARPVSFKVKLMPVKQENTAGAALRPKEVVRVVSTSVGGGGEPATICLDSDEEEPAGPVPVALTGPDSRPLPLGMPAATAPAFYPYPAAVQYPPEPVPVSLTGPDNRPVPISLTGPGFRAIPISMAGAAQAAAASHASASASFGGADHVTYSSMQRGGPVSYMMAGGGAPGEARPVALYPSAAPGPMRAMRFSLAQGQGGAAISQLGNNIYLVPAPATTTAPAPAPPQPRAPAPQLPPNVTKTVCQPGDILRLTTSGKLEIIKSARSNTTVADDEIHTIDDDEQSAPRSLTPAPKTPVIKLPELAPKAPAPTAKAPALTAKAPAPTAKAPAPAAKAPALTSKAPAPTAKAPTPTAKAPAPAPSSRARPQKAASPPGRTSRAQLVSSSSSSSDSSRSPSPARSSSAVRSGEDDPLSILRDVVHIQAPTKSKPITNKADTKRPPPSQAKPASTHTKAPQKPSPASQVTSISRGKHKNDPVAKKIGEIVNAVKTKRSELNAANKSTTSTPPARINESIDLTEVNYIWADSSKKTMTKVKSTSTGKKDAPSTVVGTSKNIILDGKSKSLTTKDTFDISAKKSVQVTNVKTVAANSAGAPRAGDKKRPAPPPDTAAKKKKTEPMTLKDFDIDDIDDIIELD